LWTLILFGLFHLGAAGLALLMQTGKTRVNWKYLGLVPLAYGIVAGAEALMAGSIVGLMSVSHVHPTGFPSAAADARDRVGASYVAGKFTMSTWIPFVWGWVNLLVLIVSSFTIQGGL
jgi:hypothetical protein